MWEGPPCRPHSLGDGSKCRRGKGLKPVCLARRCTSGCVRSPQDMIYYFSKKYFPAHKEQAALQEIFNFVQTKEESLPQAWGGFASYLMLFLIILLGKMKYLISSIMD